MRKRIISILKGPRPDAVSFVLVLVAVAALSVISVNAQCQQWLVIGDWAMEQSNAYKVSMHTQQNGTAITGTASYPFVDKKKVGGVFGSFDADTLMTGTVTGNIAGNDYYAEISFTNGGVGVYRGKINAQGIIEGTGYPREKSRDVSTFFSTRAMSCKSNSPAATTPPHHEGKLANFGKPKNPATAPAPKPPVNAPASTPRKLPDPPYIFADATRVSIGKMSGPATLTWDAGNDHPYAEIWVKINGGDEKKVVEKGKGSMQVDARIGTQYTYILTDDGVTLATVNVTVRN